jgi:hypothetical protein
MGHPVIRRRVDARRAWAGPTSLPRICLPWMGIVAESGERSTRSSNGPAVNDPPKGRVLAVAGLSLSVLITVLMSGIWLTMLDSNARVSAFAQRFCALRPPPRSLVVECAGDLTKESASGNSCDLHARATIESSLPVARLRRYYARALGMRIYPEPFLRQPMEAYDGFADGNVYVAVHGPLDAEGNAQQHFLAEAYQLDAVDGDWRCQ